MKYLLSVFIFILLSSGTPVFAQGCFDDATENELLNYFKEMHRLQNSTSQESQDSLYIMNNKFYHFLSYAVERNYTIVDDLNKLLYEGLDYSISDDHNCAVFSWEIYSFIGMHFRCGLVFYKTSDGIHSSKYLDGYAPYSVSSMLTKGGKTIYLLFGEDAYNLKGRFKRVSANVIETRYGEEGLMPASIFYDSKNDSISYKEYKYDLASYTKPVEVPDILFSKNRKKLSVPVIAENGYFAGNYNTYNFDGYKFVLEKTNTNKAAKGNIDGKAN